MKMRWKEVYNQFSKGNFSSIILCSIFSVALFYVKYGTWCITHSNYVVLSFSKTVNDAFETTSVKSMYDSSMENLICAHLLDIWILFRLRTHSGIIKYRNVFT